MSFLRGFANNPLPIHILRRLYSGMLDNLGFPMHSREVGMGIAPLFNKGLTSIPQNKLGEGEKLLINRVVDKARLAPLMMRPNLELMDEYLPRQQINMGPISSTPLSELFGPSINLEPKQQQAAEFVKWLIQNKRMGV